jgi:uncharacterized membrane protein YfcA
VIDALLPPALGPWSALALVLVSAFTSAVSAAVGIGGGVMLLAAMTLVVPVEALIPVHGAVQFGSNAGRLAVFTRHVVVRLLLPFAVGAMLGVVIGGRLVVDLPEEMILLAIGTFITVMTWARVPSLGRGRRGAFVLGGGAATVLTMFVGATGPFVMMLMRQVPMPHRALVATTAAAMAIQHGLKLVAFGALGFAFAAWTPLIAAMIAAGFAGTLAGARLLSAVPETILRTTLKVVLTLIGLQLIVRAAIGLS